MDNVISFIAGAAVCFIIMYYGTHKELRDSLLSRFRKIIGKDEEQKP